MVNLLIAPDADTVAGEGQVINILDPACGTGGMLTAAEEHIKSINPKAEVYLFGQEVNPESWAVCESEMLMRSQRGRVHFGNSFSDDGYRGKKFDYMLANPPFGVEWKKVKEEVEAEAELGRCRPLRRRPAAHQRRLVPVPAAHDLEDGAGRGQGRAG